MAPILFDEVDNLIIDKWLEVSELVAAYEAVRDKAKRQLQAVEDSLSPWASEQELELETWFKEGEFRMYQRDWLQDAKDQPWAALAVGGFVVDDVLAGDGHKLYACVYCSSGKRKRLNKDVFGESLKKAIGAKQAAFWGVDTDRSCPLNRYASESTAKSIFLDSDKLNVFVAEQFKQLVEFVEPVSDAIRVALKSGRGAD